MQDFFKDKVVVVTGGSTGIGKALIDALIPRGAKIATCGRNQDKLYDLQVQYSGHLIHTVVADVSIYDECRNFIESTISAFGGIDILINNAGISMRALFKDARVEVIRTVMEVNFFGSVYCTKLALDSIISRKGIIAGISSIAGYRGLPGRSGYSASKFAMNGWLEALRTELRDSGVNVIWIAPGFTASNIRQAALDPSGRSTGESRMEEETLMQAEVCALHILNALEKGKRTTLLTFNGIRTVWLNKLFPALTDKLIHRFYFSKGKLVK